MNKTLTSAVAIATAMAVAVAPALAQQPAAGADRIVIGVLTDLSGVYSDLSGQGSVTAAKMAVDDFGGKVLGRPVSVISADMQNKADIAANKAREWYDTGGVKYIIDLPGSAVALAVVQIAKAKNRLVNVTAAVSTRITNEDCGSTVFHWSPDSAGGLHRPGGAGRRGRHLVLHRGRLRRWHRLGQGRVRCGEAKRRHRRG